MKTYSVSGTAGAGKSTVAGMLGGKDVAFAGALKVLCQEVFGATREQLHDPALKNVAFDVPVTLTSDHVEHLLRLMPTFVQGIDYPSAADLAAFIGMDEGPFTLNTPRELMQFVGTELIRTGVRDDWHALSVLNSIGDAEVVVVSDARFPNELAFLLSRFPEHVPIFIERPGVELGGDAGKHKSETCVEEVREMVAGNSRGVVVVNDGTVDDLRAKIAQL